MKVHEHAKESMVTKLKKEISKAAKPLKKAAVKKPAAKKPVATAPKKVTVAAEKPKRAAKKAAPVKKETLAKEHAVKAHPAVTQAPLPKPVVSLPVAPVPHEAHKPAAPPELHKPAHAVPPKPVSEIHKPAAVAPKPAQVQKEHLVAAAAPAKPTVVEAPKPAPEKPVEEEPKNTIELTLPITVKDLSIKLQEKPSVIIKRLMDMRIMAGINQFLDEQAVEQICRKYGFKVKKALGVEEALLSNHAKETVGGILRQRPPVVTFMGHVDHGKTSLLDAIRRSKVAETEHGGITQHIGAYEVILPKGSISFLDTPGHEAFTAMRARGAKITDIVVLVVAADDGIMPQTIEAIDHAKEAKVPIIVAINKIDKPGANVDKIKKQLMEHGLTPEDWQGQTITVPVSAKTGAGIKDLLEMILLQAEVLELKANYEKLASGVVVEGRMDKQRGPIATMLIQSGTLRLNDHIIVGQHYGKVRALFDDRGSPLTEATPSRPVEVMGIAGVVQAGEQFFAVQDEKEAKEIAASRHEKEKLSQVKTVKRISLDDLHARVQEGTVKELKIILKADVSGSLEAIKESLKKLNISEIQINIIHEGTGTINGSDIILAAASDALVIGFHVEADDKAKELVEKEGVDVRLYNVIYELNNDLKAAVEGMLEPKIKKVFLGRAEARKVFKLSSSGVVAGSFVVKGKITRGSEVRVVRGEEVVYEGKISALKRFKDDVKEVAEGFECGISLVNFQDILEGDLIEAFEIQKISRKL
jgi:translation initiation factor IF-2